MDRVTGQALLMGLQRVGRNSVTNTHTDPLSSQFFLSFSVHTLASRNMVWGGRREEGLGWGTHVYLWRIHVDIWQNQYNIVKLKNKIKKETLECVEK